MKSKIMRRKKRKENTSKEVDTNAGNKKKLKEELETEK